MQSTHNINPPPQNPATDYDYQIYYNKWHPESPEHVRFMGRLFAAHLAPVVKGREQEPVLDVGCGKGFALSGLKQLGFTNLQGIELDPGQAKSARELGLNVERVTDTVGYLKQSPGKFAVILLLDVLEHIPVAEQISFLRAIHGALRENGRLVIQVPNASSMFASIWRYNDYTHTSSFTDLSLQFCVLNAGFSNVTIIREKPLCRPSLRLWQPRARASWGRWIFEKLWRAASRHEFGADTDKDIFFGINLFGYADK